jgi:hypothetical protein
MAALAEVKRVMNAARRVPVVEFDSTGIMPTFKKEKNRL